MERETEGRKEFSSATSRPSRKPGMNTNSRGTNFTSNPSRHVNDHPNRFSLFQSSSIPVENLQQYQSSTPTNRQRPPFSLSGNNPTQSYANAFVDPNYYTLNPEYQKPPNTPLWGLSKPLPRVVRPGMKRGRGSEKISRAVEDTRMQRDEPGSAEVIPQVGMIRKQRDEPGKGNTKTYGERQSQRFISRGNERGPHVRSKTCLKRSEDSNVDRFGTPKEERGDPMEEIGRNNLHSPSLSDASTETGDVGDRRLGSRNSLNLADTVVSDFSYRDSSQIDLEAAKRVGEWSLEDEEADQYIGEERDMHNMWASVRAKFREPLAECLATMIVVIVGICTNLAVQTSKKTSGSYQSTNWAWGLGTTLGIYISGGISGGHLNPAVSLALCLYRGFPFRKALIYITAQVVGSFLGGLIAYGVYRDAILAADQTDGQSIFFSESSNAFFTQPAPFSSIGGSFANELVATAILVCAILALGDDSNAPPGAGMHAFIIGLIITLLTMAFGYNTGACLNPARDFGPRMAVAAVGYGGKVFTIGNAWWAYGAWGATITGALAGGFLYDAAIFVGGESPLNYPRIRRRQIKEKVKTTFWPFLN